MCELKYINKLQDGVWTNSLNHGSFLNNLRLLAILGDGKPYRSTVECVIRKMAFLNTFWSRQYYNCLGLAKMLRCIGTKGIVPFSICYSKYVKI